MPATLGISTLMLNIAALWKKAAECKHSVVEVIAVWGFVGFFPTGMQSVKQERELLQHHLKGKGKRLLGEKCSFSAFRERKKREIPSMYILPPFLKPTEGDQWDSCCFLRNEKLLGLLTLQSWAYFP